MPARGVKTLALGELTARRGGNLISARKFNSQAGRSGWVSSCGGGWSELGVNHRRSGTCKFAPPGALSPASPSRCAEQLSRTPGRVGGAGSGSGYAPRPQICPFQIPPGPSVLGHSSNPQPAQLTRGRGFRGRTGTKRPSWGRPGLRVDWESRKSVRKMGTSRI